jgi:RNA polymerase sigma factor (sigma-70 family)
MEVAPVSTARPTRATPRSLEDAYRAHHRELMRVATAITGDPELARDAVQEGLARALAKRRTFRATGSIDGWLWIIVVNAARNIGARAPRLDAPIEREAAEVPPVDHDIRELVGRLPERERLALFLRYYADLDYSTIGRILGVRLGTVSATLNHAQASLRRLLEEEDNA